MPIVRFLGFPDGETVSMVASQGGATDSATVETWNAAASGGSEPALTIEVIRAPSTARYAPEAVWFNAQPTGFDLPDAPENSIAYEPAFHEIEYEWDFGDAGDQFLVPQKLLDAHRDANFAIGQQAAHVYRNPGSYTVTCTARRVTDPETMEVEEAQFSTQVVVGDMESLWTVDNTVIVAHDGDFDGAPASNYQLTGFTSTSDLGHWEGLLRNGSIPAEGPVRVLFKRGGVYDNSANSNEGLCHRNETKAYSLVFIGDWGSGDKPISNPGDANCEERPFVWRNIHFRGAYDTETELGADGFAVGLRGAGYHLFTGCDFTNDNGGLIHVNEDGSQPVEHWTVLHDCLIKDHRAYGVFHKGRPRGVGPGIDRLIMLGCAELDSPTQAHGQGSPNGQKQGPMRGLDFEDVIIQGCEFFCRIGWTGQGRWDDDDVSMTAVQPTLRFAEGRPPTGDMRNGNAVVSRCTAEGAGLIDVNGDRDAEPRVGNLLVDQNLLIALPSVRSFGKAEAGALTWRNCLHLKPDVPGAPGIRNFLEIQITTKEVPFDEVARRAEPMRVYNNTFIALDDSDARTSPFQGIDGYTTYIDMNNVIHIAGNPGYVRHEEIAPVDDTVLWDSRYKGRREWTGGAIEPLRTQYETPADTISLYRPALTSGIANDAMGTISYFDLLGNARLTTQSRGALEP